MPDVEPTARWPRLQLDLPDTEIFGEVHFGQEPLTEPATIQVHDGAYAAPLDTEPDGSFTFRGIRPGDLHLQALLESDWAGSLRSAPTRLSLEEGVPFGPVHLVLEPQKMLRGTVVSPTGQGVAGALVMGFPADTASRLANPPQDYTDAAGAFTLEGAFLLRSSATTRVPGGVCRHAADGCCVR